MSLSFLTEPQNVEEESIQAWMLAALNEPNPMELGPLTRAWEQCRYWASHGDARAQRLLDGVGSAIALRDRLDTFPPLHRHQLDESRITVIPEEAVGWISTSGSTGIPLRYGVSKRWRIAHRASFRLGYQWMTQGRLKGYLDPSLEWAMARAPGGPRDDFAHLVECAPEKGRMVYSRSPDQCRPQVVHGSPSTIIEMLEDKAVQRWEPFFVFLTYEQALPSHLKEMHRHWPQTRIHIEYSSNDGSAMAFSCPVGRLHFWPFRALPRLVNGGLVVTDLWNEATAFIGYACGDEVTWNFEKCGCGCPLPLVDVTGRAGGWSTLKNGRRVSHICPLDGDEMDGLRGLKVLIQDGDHARFQYVPDEQRSPDLARIEDRLRSIGFESITFERFRSVSSIRQSKGKFKVVLDLRRQQR